MKFRHIGSSDEKIALQMTPMIDIVFQLLIFFIMSFKIVAQEGDFNIKMPMMTRQAGEPDQTPPIVIHIRLDADTKGRLLSTGGINVNDGDYICDSVEELHIYIIGLIGGDVPSSRADVEVELSCAYDLRYEHVIQVITAVSGYIDHSTGQVEKLVEKINFAPPVERGGP